MEYLLINDPRLDEITIFDNQEELLDLRARDEIMVVEEPELALMQNDYAFVRKSVFERLCKAQARLPHNWRLILFEGLRSLDVQASLFKSFQEVNRQRLGVLATEEEIFLATCHLVSPVRHFDGKDIIPPHSTGGAVDVSLVDANGKLLDMGMNFLDWQTEPPELAATNCDAVSLVCQERRRILCEALTAEGFVNYPFEYWHYSWGDRYWAYHTGSKASLYGPIGNQSL